MTICELEIHLKQIKVPNNIYSIMNGGVSNEMLCITNEKNNWIVYYSEKGRKNV